MAGNLADGVDPDPTAQEFHPDPPPSEIGSKGKKMNLKR